MKQLTVSIPENFYKVFVEFFKHIPDARIEDVEELSIPQWHKEETLKRLKSSKPENFILWAKAKKQLKSK